MEKQRVKESGSVQSIHRALTILERLGACEDGLTLKEVALQVALPPSSTHRILTTLQRQRFVRFDPATMCWSVGVQAFLVGNAFARSRDMVTLAIPFMRRLMVASGETVNFFMLDGSEVVCMAQVQSQHTVRAISRPGGGAEMHRSAAGKMILAHMTDEEVAAILERKGMARYTDHTITTPEALRSELAKIRQRGFSVDNEEFSLGLRCIAAPIHDETGSVYAAVSIAGPANRITEARTQAMGELVEICARSVTSEFGGSASSLGSDHRR
ncbi:IclR family transcriptional regulator [Rhizobium paknamense]|uniref:IclR family acetate operon transcriptional repressor n=1 Tax=Rhizobium paknamense TaxID=1206817 RepID=A0ABU0IEE1_9HYPH|nr:IclR family transcriptional regulator C-terminal domain-containing protein [Rhizobium paknamense]MDQ0455616.1 IclR family acetate operon transcriptional repressor [Rhizobium paknamense]